MIHRDQSGGQRRERTLFPIARPLWVFWPIFEVTATVGAHKRRRQGQGRRGLHIRNERRRSSNNTSQANRSGCWSLIAFQIGRLKIEEEQMND